VALTFASFDRDGEFGVSVNVSIFDMGTPTNAFGVFSGERSSQTEQLPLGRESYRSGANFYIWKGQYYIRIIATDTTAEMKRIGMDIGQRLTGYLRDSGESVWGLTVLPEEGLIPGSIQYFAVDAFGLDFLTDTYTAVYDRGGHTVTFFLSRQEDAGTALEVVKKYAAHAGKYGKGVTSRTVDGLDLTICDMGKKGDIVFRKKNIVAGIVDVTDEHFAALLAGELYQQLMLP
jgi:hypothetical protein